jgi:hypothetical protein
MQCITNDITVIEHYAVSNSFRIQIIIKKKIYFAWQNWVMCILHVNHRKVNRTIIMSLFKLYIMIFKLWLRAGPSWQHHRPLSKAVHGVTTYTTTRRNKNTHDNFKLMKIKYILCIKFSIRTRCSLQYAAVGNGILHTGGKHLHGRTNVCFYDFRLDFETVTTV